MVLECRAKRRMVVQAPIAAKPDERGSPRLRSAASPEQEVDLVLLAHDQVLEHVL